MYFCHVTVIPESSSPVVSLQAVCPAQLSPHRSERGSQLLLPGSVRVAST